MYCDALREVATITSVHNPGPIIDFLKAMCRLRQAVDQNGSTKKVRIAIFTARSAPAHERMINTLRTWGLILDETFLLGGLEKGPFLNIFGADI